MKSNLNFFVPMSTSPLGHISPRYMKFQPTVRPNLVQFSRKLGRPHRYSIYLIILADRTFVLYGGLWRLAEVFYYGGTKTTNLIHCPYTPNLMITNANDTGWLGYNLICFQVEKESRVSRWFRTW